MKVLTQATRDVVYNAPIIQQDSSTYTPVPNKVIMDLIESKIQGNGLTLQSDEYKVSTSKEGLVKGVIGAYNITTADNDFGQRVMFRNSYDKSMSFAIVVGSVVWICSNGCISGDYQYKRVHRGVFENNTSTTMQDVIENINGGFTMLQNSFEHNRKQLLDLKNFEIGPQDAYNILGELFFTMTVLNVSQMSIVKRELSHSHNFKHLGDKDFTAYDLYNHITESLKTSHPLTYISDHVKTHKMFEEIFNV